MPGLPTTYPKLWVPSQYHTAKSKILLNHALSFMFFPNESNIFYTKKRRTMPCLVQNKKQVLAVFRTVSQLIDIPPDSSFRYDTFFWLNMSLFFKFLHFLLPPTTWLPIWGTLKQKKVNLANIS